LGQMWFSTIGVNIPKTTQNSPLARQCLDWTERQHHLAGPLGTALFRALTNQSWIKTTHTPRQLVVTHIGWQALSTHLDLNQASFTKP